MGTVIWSIIILFSIVLRLEAAKFLKELRLLEKNIPSLFLQHLEQFYQMGYRLDTVWLIYKYFLPFDLTPEFQPSSGRFFLAAEVCICPKQGRALQGKGNVSLLLSHQCSS